MLARFIGNVKKLPYQTKTFPGSFFYKQSSLISTYEFKSIEDKWNKRWEQEKATYDFLNPSEDQLKNKNQQDKNEFEIDKDIFYALCMFPYPSGKLHMGHVRVYTIGDVISKMEKMRGKKVIFPIGWDSFGLPAENAARLNKCEPSDWTDANISVMKNQLLPLGISFQWNRELKTSSKEYYKWTQWIFLRLLEKGLAYQKNSYVYWDPVDLTVLANEQVLEDGTSWRSGAMVERKLMNQWYFKISDYAQELTDDLELLNNKWPSNVLQMQRNWIGKGSNGVVTQFQLKNENDPNFSAPIDIFTSKIETIYGVTFIGLSPLHEIIDTIKTQQNKQFHEKLQKFQSPKSSNFVSEEVEIEGIKVEGGFYIQHPIHKDLKLPVFICNYIIDTYGTGAVMGVPAHDTRDATLAQLFNLPSIPVLDEENNQLINSAEFSSTPLEIAQDKIVDYLKSSKLATRVKLFRLHDWLVSRQRYWGAPIPIIHCDDCGVVPVPEKDLPVELPKTSDSFDEWVHTNCPCCGKAAKRERDTMDTFVDSSWYYIRYLDANNDNQLVEQDKINKYLPVDIYIGGIEHAILHLLYSRFIHKFLYSLQLTNTPEPFSCLLTQGMVHSQTFKLAANGKYVPKNLIQFKGEKAIYTEDPELEVTVTHEKMSKSKLNGLEPQELIEEYGADTTRLYILFKAPPQKVLEWDDKGIVGQQRWLIRIWNICEQVISYSNSNSTFDPFSKELEINLHQTIQGVTKSISIERNFNVAVAHLMKFTNYLSTLNEKLPENYKNAVEKLLIMLSPFAPYISSELWEVLQNSLPKDQISPFPILEQAWPIYDAKLAAMKSTVEFVVQINGKTKSSLEIPFDVENTPESSKELQEYITSHSSFARYFTGNKIKKVIFVPKNFIINFVLEK